VTTAFGFPVEVNCWCVDFTYWHPAHRKGERRIVTCCTETKAFAYADTLRGVNATVYPSQDVLHFCPCGECPASAGAA